jgi:hypothetical protein
MTSTNYFHMLQRSIFFILLLCLQFTLTAQTIPSPSDFLGYELGSHFSRHHEVVDYFKTLSKIRPQQLRLEQYGLTNERRPLYLAFVSSEENLENLEAIRRNHLKNAGIIEGESSNPEVAIVWLSYNVHGNEASSTEASMLTLYTLLTERQDLLKNTVVIIDPCINPDGRDRYVNWYNETASQPYDTDVQASEHNEPWPGGRPNHYLFDLNRDWAWATQIETQSRLKVYNKWMPHIHVDFHEQGVNEPYYFAPAAEPYHEIISDWQREFQTKIGQNHAKYFDENGWLFFTRERFDLLYPSYGDTYPTYMGAIGMTYEQAGHGMAGLGIVNDEGELLTLKDRLQHHTTTGISTVEMASKEAKRLNIEFSEFFDNSDLKIKSFVLRGNENKLNAVKSLLDKHDIYYSHAKPGKVSGYHYSNAKDDKMETSENDLVIYTDQPKGKMVKVLFEPNTKLSDSLTYDITAWSIPYAYGLEAMASTSKVPSEVESKITESQKLVDAYGYACRWESLDDGLFLADLLQNDFKVRFTEKPFKSNGVDFNRGSLIITKGDNKHIENFLAELSALAENHKQELFGITTGFSEVIPDIGSPDIKLINRQHIAILSGKGTSSLSYGELWHFFEKQLQYPVTSINTEDLSRTNLNQYNVLIMPNGYYNSILEEQDFTKITDWVKQGGKVIAIGNALRSFAGKDGFSLKPKSIAQDEDQVNLTAYAERERAAVSNMITGAVFKTKVDNTHPMAFGYSSDYFTLKLGTASYELLQNGFNVAHINNPKVFSGFAGSNATENLKDSLVFGEERKGSGSFIYLVDNVMFRSFWENGKLFLVNSIFFVNHNAFTL